MQLETIRCLVAGLTDGTIGVNAMIDALTLEGGDSAPPHVTVYDQVRHGWVARKSFSLTNNSDIILPALIVFIDQAIDVQDAEVETIKRDAHVPVTIAYLDAKSATETGTYNAMQTERAVERFLRKFMDNGNVAQRTRNNVCVELLLSLQPQPTAVVKEDVFIGASTACTFLVREQMP